MNHGHHQHSVHTTPDGGTTTTTTAPIVVDPGTAPTPAPAPTTVVVTGPPAATQSVSLSAMLVIAIGAALAGGAAVYFWPTLVGEVEKVTESGATENPIRRSRKKRKSR
jgi:hypothetical protein